MFTSQVNFLAQDNWIRHDWVKLSSMNELIIFCSPSLKSSRLMFGYINTLYVTRKKNKKLSYIHFHCAVNMTPQPVCHWLVSRIITQMERNYWRMDPFDLMGHYKMITVITTLPLTLKISTCNSPSMRWTEFWQHEEVWIRQAGVEGLTYDVYGHQTTWKMFTLFSALLRTGSSILQWKVNGYM